MSNPFDDANQWIADQHHALTELDARLRKAGADMLSISDNPNSVRLSAYYDDPPPTQRKAQRAARLILHAAKFSDISRTGGLLIVSGFVGERLHMAAYWPHKLGG